MKCREQNAAFGGNTETRHANAWFLGRLNEGGANVVVIWDWIIEKTIHSYKFQTDSNMNMEISCFAMFGIEHGIT